LGIVAGGGFQRHIKTNVDGGVFYNKSQVLAPWLCCLGEVEERAWGRRPWGSINTLYPAIQKRVFKQKFRPKYA